MPARAPSTSRARKNRIDLSRLKRAGRDRGRLLLRRKSSAYDRMFACVIVSRYASARGIVGPPWGQRQVRRRGQTKSAAQGSALSAVDFPSFADTALVNG